MFSFDFRKHKLLGKIVFILGDFATLSLKHVFSFFDIYNN